MYANVEGGLESANQAPVAKRIPEITTAMAIFYSVQIGSRKVTSIGSTLLEVPSLKVLHWKCHYRNPSIEVSS